LFFEKTADLMELLWHGYRYYPYERALARREVATLLSSAEIDETDVGIRLRGGFDQKAAKRLVYFAATSVSGQTYPTTQGRIERVNGNDLNRQSTRYSAHGLHEYKGKFNPQIARAILNILNIQPGARVLDPFCGSGTALLECVHLGIRAIGADINPLAVFVANAKVDAMRIPTPQHRRALDAALKRSKTIRLPNSAGRDARGEYLCSWFASPEFKAIERLRIAIEAEHSTSTALLLAVASNLLRDYSLQDPRDLRIRRRKDSVPTRPFHEAFEDAAIQFLAKLEDAQAILRRFPAGCRALLLDSRNLRQGIPGIGTARFDCALTSPPYATALPYIDTQRLSLVWLGLVQPSEIQSLEARLIGSREVRGESKRQLLANLEANSVRLPAAQAEYCRALQRALSDRDGFRRQAVPLLLYRYFAGMAQVFRALRPLTKDNAPFALIVGHNHTILGGKRFDIDTPAHLAAIAQSCGWAYQETIPLQTYQRYGYHMENAVNDEGLVIVRAA
jgi:SAM-dependent methyltransferase